MIRDGSLVTFFEELTELGHVSESPLRGHLVKPLIQCGVRLWVEILPLVPQWLRLLLRYVLGRLLDSHAAATRIAFVV